MQASSKAVVVEFLRGRGFTRVLDAPSGGGWLQEALGAGKAVDGIDLYAESAPGYRRFWKFDLDDGLPDDCGDYDLACCCEGWSTSAIRCGCCVTSIVRSGPAAR